MTSILLGCIAFALIAVYDWAQMHDISWLKPLFLLSGGVFLVGLLGVLSIPPEAKFATWVRVLAWIGLASFLPLMLYSILIEIPLKTPHDQPDNHPYLVDTGTYALVRHPGVLWFTGAAICMVLLHPSRVTLSAAITWTFMDVVLVWAEDRNFFPNTFPGYAEYKTRTPFLIPNQTSLRRCWNTFKTGVGAIKDQYQD
jgi:protein-S-isoprenylcysteine O-methyltransferase Ste14